MRYWIRLFFALALAAVFSACGEETAEESTELPNVETPVALVAIDPRPSGTFLAFGGWGTLTFESDPGNVYVNGRIARGEGVTRRFCLTAYVNEVVWDRGGKATLEYGVDYLAPGFDLHAPMLDPVPPTLIGSSVPDGGEADAVEVNMNGIVLQFDEDIGEADLLLTEVDGPTLDWEASLDGATVWLLPNVNKPLAPGREYRIEGEVYDAGCLSGFTEISIRFSTKPQE